MLSIDCKTDEAPIEVFAEPLLQARFNGVLSLEKTTNHSRALTKTGTKFCLRLRLLANNE